MALDNRGRRDTINVREYGLTGLASQQITQTQLNVIFSAAIALKRPVYFPNGIYVFPKNFHYNFQFNDIVIFGEDKYNTIITTAFGGDTIKIVERIDLSIPKGSTKDGYYRVNITGQIDTTWGTNLVNVDIDDYIKVENGAATMTTLEQVKLAGLVTELDVTKPDPGFDGKYVVASTNTSVGGGGYTHSNLPYNTSIKYITGTVLTRTAGVWARLAPSLGFQFSASFEVEDIQFNDVEFYLFTPYNITKPDQELYRVNNCIFKHVIRINALDRQYQAAAIQSQGFVKGAAYHFQDGASFCYKKIEFTNNECSYIHTCIFWEVPPTRKFVVNGNVVRDCYTFSEIFINLPMGSSLSDDSEDSEGFSNKTQTYYEDNHFENLIHYSPVSHGGHHMMRGNGRGSFRNNRLINCTGTIFYISGNNNSVEGNVVIPYVQHYPDRETGVTWGKPSIFHIKTGNQNEVSSTIISNNKVEKSALIDIIDIKNTNTFINVTGNKMMTMGYSEWVITSDTLPLNKELLHLIKDLNVFKTLAGITPTQWAAGVYVSGKFVENNGILYQCMSKTTGTDLDPAADIAANGLNGAKWRAIAVNTYMYWDIRRRCWFYFPGTVGIDSGWVDKNYEGDSTYPINLSNNVVYAYNMFQMYDGNLHDVTVENNDIYISRDLISASVGSEGFGAHVKNLKLYGNRIYRGGATVSTKYFNSLNSITAVNNDFYYAMSTFDIAFRNECHWINNRVKPWPKFANVANISSLSLPSASCEYPVNFRRVLPAAWSAKTYAVGAFAAYNSQVYQCISAVTSANGAPDVETTKWLMVDDPLLYIKDGFIDSYMARQAAMTWGNLNRVFIDGTLFNIRLVNDWTSTFRTTANNGTSNRFAMWFPTANANITRDVTLTNVKFDFENRNNRHMFYITQANCLRITNLTINNVPQFGAYPLNKMMFVSGAGTMSVDKLIVRSSDDLVYDAAFENIVTAKEFQSRNTLTLTTDGSYVLPKGTLIDKIVVNSTAALSSFKIGTSAGGAQISEQSIESATNAIYNVDLYADTATTIYFSGITGNSSTVKIQIFKR